MCFPITARPADIQSIRDLLEPHVRVVCGGPGGSSHDYMGTHVGYKRRRLLTHPALKRRSAFAAEIAVTVGTRGRANHAQNCYRDFTKSAYCPRMEAYEVSRPCLAWEKF